MAMTLKDFHPDSDVILLADFKSIPARTIGAVKKETKTGYLIEWELPGKPVTHIKFTELHLIEKYTRLKPVSFGDEFPW